MSGLYLSLLVVVAGLCSLGLEMTVLSLIAPYFGTTQIIWACVIGLTMLALAVGYLAGGRWADRRPQLSLLCALLSLTGLLLALLPGLARPLLIWSVSPPTPWHMGLGLLGTLVLAAVPTMLLGMVSPLAMRLALTHLDDAGRTAGSLFALSTGGSLLGTFGPVFLLIPCLGTSRTFAFLGFLLSLVAWPGSGRWWRWGGGLALLTQLWLLTSPASVARPGLTGVVYEGHSFYNFIRVQVSGPRVALQLNESAGIHSLYDRSYQARRDPDSLRTHSYWDYPAIAPFLYPKRRPDSVSSLCQVGFCAGTTPRIFQALYGETARVDGAEIDPQIIEVGRRFFEVPTDSANFSLRAQDGRIFINQLQRRYDVIVIDCFRWPYVPGHLVTRECFAKAKAHLNPQGVLVVKCDRGLMGQRIMATMKAEFPQVFELVGLALAPRDPVGDGVANMRANAASLESGPLKNIMAEALKTCEGRRPFREFRSQGSGLILSDDHCPTEALVHLGLLRRLVFH